MIELLEQLQKRLFPEYPISKEFTKCDGYVFSEKRIMTIPKTDEKMTLGYHVKTDFFRNEKYTIAYAFSEFSIDYLDIPDDLSESNRIWKKLDGLKRIIAYSETYDGFPVMSGNIDILKYEEIHNPRRWAPVMIDDMVLNWVGGDNIDKVLNRHVEYVQDLDIKVVPEIVQNLKYIYENKIMIPHKTFEVELSG